MNQLTLRRIPDDVENELRHQASKTGSSLNQTAIDALKRGLGLQPPDRRKRDLSALAGKWSVEEADRFDRSLEIFEQIDEELWQ